MASTNIKPFMFLALYDLPPIKIYCQPLHLSLNFFPCAQIITTVPNGHREHQSITRTGWCEQCPTKLAPQHIYASVLPFRSHPNYYLQLYCLCPNSYNASHSLYPIAGVAVENVIPSVIPRYALKSLKFAPTVQQYCLKKKHYMIENNLPLAKMLFNKILR